MPSTAWEVYLNGKLIDIVFFNQKCDGGAPLTKEMVYESLVNYDGYNPEIIVRRAM